MKQARNPNYLLVFLLMIFALEAILFSSSSFKSDQAIRKEEIRIEHIGQIIDQTKIIAKAVSVYDITSRKKIYSRNDETPMPIASIAKIMTVAVGLQGHDLDEVVSVSPEAVNQAGDFGIFQNEKWKLRDIAKFTLLASANDGAYVLSQNDKDLLEKMNIKARKIGAQNVSFLNFTGLDIRDSDGLPVQAGAYATVQDVNIMARYALLAEPGVFGVTTLPEIDLRSASGFVHSFKNTNPVIGKIPNLLFSKTGYTDIAGGTLVIIFKNKIGHEIAVTVLGSTFDDRFLDMENLVNILYNI